MRMFIKQLTSIIFVSAIVLTLQSHMVHCTSELDHFIYGTPPTTEGILKKDFYGQAVNLLPICCVDIFIYNPSDKSYFMVRRTTPPGVGVWWLPGGRLFKGESFIQCALRKCKDEVGLSVTPCALLGVYSTVFDTSAWKCPTHTVNIAVLAFCDNSYSAKLDNNHDQYRWVSLEEVPEDTYIKQVYYAALAKLSKEY